mmetsp:Transcript_1391/g.3091  ORF Transcript_1391/g.3091 Transcript_1391/m.3091 type:complete len:325 (+) Transcript_1391:1138-2112(+)
MGRVLVDHVLVRARAVQAHIVDINVLNDDRQATIGVVLQLPVRVDPLVPKIVDDEEAAGVAESAPRPHSVSEVDRQKGRLPVVGDESDALAEGCTAGLAADWCLQGSKAKESEAIEVVRVLHAEFLVVVETTRSVKGWMVNEDVVHTSLFAELVVLMVVLDLVVRVEEIYGLVGHPRDVLVVVVHRANSHGPVPPLGQLHGQGSGDQSETARLGPGADLAGDDHDRNIGMFRQVLRLRQMLQSGRIQIVLRDVSECTKGCLSTHGHSISLLNVDAMELGISFVRGDLGVCDWFSGCHDCACGHTHTHARACARQEPKKKGKRFL